MEIIPEWLNFSFEASSQNVTLCANISKFVKIFLLSNNWTMAPHGHTSFEALLVLLTSFAIHSTASTTCSSLTDGVCYISCSGEVCNEGSVECTSNAPCHIDCSSDESCKEANIDATSATDVIFTCSTDGSEACKDATFSCGSASCELQCDTSDSCDGANLYVGFATSFQCTGNCPWSISIEEFTADPTTSSPVTANPTRTPSVDPTNTPTMHPTVSTPTAAPVSAPYTMGPTKSPSVSPTTSQPMTTPTEPPSTTTTTNTGTSTVTTCDTVSVLQDNQSLCFIACEPGVCSDNIQCKSAGLCYVHCNGAATCKDATIEGSTADDVTFYCTTLSDDTESCKDSTLHCGSADCRLVCGSGDSDSCDGAQVYVGSATSFQCDGNCPSHILSEMFSAAPTTASPSAAPIVSDHLEAGNGGDDESDDEASDGSVHPILCGLVFVNTSNVCHDQSS